MIVNKLKRKKQDRTNQSSASCFCMIAYPFKAMQALN